MPNDPDNSWNNTLNNPNVLQETVLSVGTYPEIYLDELNSISNKGRHNFVGQGDEFDYAKITLNSAANLSFRVDATDSVKLTVYKLVAGSSKPKEVMSDASKSNSFSFDTAAKLFEAGEYYVSIQSTNAAKGGSAYYNLLLNGADKGTEYFTSADNGDDWDDLKTMGPKGHVANGGVLEDSSSFSGWVGYGDTIDYTMFTLENGAKLSFTVSSSDAAKFTLYSLAQDKKGNYVLKNPKATEITYNKEYEEYTKTTKSVLLQPGIYCFSVQTTKTSAHYDVYLNDEYDKNDNPYTEFYTDGNNGDDWTDLSVNGADGLVGNAGVLETLNQELASDWVGFGDGIDYFKFTLNCAANLSFTVNSYDQAVKFTVYSLTKDKKGKYKLTSVLKPPLTTAKNSDDEFSKTSKAVFLKSGDYYFSVQASKPTKAGGTEYDVNVNAAGSEFYTQCNNNDDWDDFKTEGPRGKVGNAGALDVLGKGKTVLTDWVGAGDTVDYFKFSLENASKLSFTVTSDSKGVKFTVFNLVQSKKGTYTLKQIQKPISTAANGGSVTSAALSLEAGEYYFAVQTAKAAKSGGTGYTLALSNDCEFFTNGDGGDDWTDLETKGAAGMVGNVGELYDFSSELVTDWVGLGDHIDYKHFSIDCAADLSFTVTAEEEVVKFTVYSLTQDKKGKYVLKTLQTTDVKNASGGKFAATTALLSLAAGDYYFSVQASKTTKSGTDYTVSLSGSSKFSAVSENGFPMPETDIFALGTLTEASQEILTDWVGYGNLLDCGKFTIASAAKLSFSVNATGAAKFGIYERVEDVDGNSFLKAIQVTELVKQSGGAYAVTTDSQVLDAGEYYIVMRAGSSTSDSSADYNITLNQNATVFFTNGDNSDDWTDRVTAGPNGQVAKLGSLAGLGNKLQTDWVGYGDAIDYTMFKIDYAAKLQFTVSATDAAEFSIYELEEARNGTFSLTPLKTVTLVKSGNEYTAETGFLLLEAGEYYFSVQSTNAAAGGNASYTVELDDVNSTFFTQIDNSDDWTDYKENGDGGEVGDVGSLSEFTDVIVSDWVGFGDTIDYNMFSLDTAAKLKFKVASTDATEFAVYRLVEMANEAFLLDTIQTISLSTPNGAGEYAASGDFLMLEAGDYFFSVQSTNADLGGNASYTVSLDTDVCAFFSEGDNTDDWTDLETEGPDGEVGNAGSLDELTYDIVSDWVGFGDAVDYMAISLDNAAKLRFKLDATDATEFSVYSLDVVERNDEDVFSLNELQKTTLSKNSEGTYAATTGFLLLEAGDYYIAMRSTNADQGGSAYYNVFLDDENSVFYTNADNSDDWTDMRTAGANGDVSDIGPLDGISSELVNDWVGFGDAIDYNMFQLDTAAELSFIITANEDVNFTLYQLLQAPDGTFSLKQLQTTSLTKQSGDEGYKATTTALHLDAGDDYCFAIQSTTADQGGSAYYTVSLNVEGSTFHTEEPPADDSLDSALDIADVLNIGQSAETPVLGSACGLANDDLSGSVKNDWNILA